MGKSVIAQFLSCFPLIWAMSSCAGQQPAENKENDNQKATKEVTVAAPTAVSSKINGAQAITIVLTNSGKVYLQFGDSIRKYDIFNALNKNKQLNLNDVNIDKLMKLDSIGIPFARMKTMLAKSNSIQKQPLPGIPCKADKNELADWLKASVEIVGLDRIEKRILLQGNENMRYPVFKHVKSALKKNHIFRIRIVSTPY